MMEQREEFLRKAQALKPILYEKQVEAPNPYATRLLRRGDSVCLDFGAHLVGRVRLQFGCAGSHPDAPAWIRLKFAERLCELSENVEAYNGWISRGWIQHELLHLDVLPVTLSLPRRYAFRYMELEVLDTSGKYALRLERAACTATTSADEERLIPYRGESALARMDAIACNTLRSCMQEVFEDGPKRDRRLWLGDLRLQASANYETFRNYDLVKRCLYLFAATARSDGRVASCLFLEPRVEADDISMFDYALFFIPTLLDYYKATGDRETLTELAPTCRRQLEAAQEFFEDNRLVKDVDDAQWCFVDWNLRLNKQASAQGIYLYCLKAAEEIEKLLGESERAAACARDYAAKKAAAELLWDEERRVYLSGAVKQISWASQVWLTLGGAVHGGAELLARVKDFPEAEKMMTPYMYHNYVDALITAGERAAALDVLKSYWGGMVDAGADTFWELYDPDDPNASPYGGTIVNSYCHAWSCAPAFFLRKYFSSDASDAPTK